MKTTTWTYSGTTTGDGVGPDGVTVLRLTPNPTVACSIVVQVTLTSTGTLTLNGWVDGVTAVALLATNLHDGTTTSSITAAGLYRVDATGLRAVWPNASANGSGIVITAQQVDG